MLKSHTTITGSRFSFQLPRAKGFVDCLATGIRPPMLKRSGMGAGPVDEFLDVAVSHRLRPCVGSIFRYAPQVLDRRFNIPARRAAPENAAYMRVRDQRNRARAFCPMGLQAVPNHHERRAKLVRSSLDRETPRSSRASTLQRLLCEPEVPMHPIPPGGERQWDPASRSPCDGERVRWRMTGASPQRRPAAPGQRGHQKRRFCR